MADGNYVMYEYGAAFYLYVGGGVLAVMTGLVLPDPSGGSVGILNCMFLWCLCFN